MNKNISLKRSLLHRLLRMLYVLGGMIAVILALLSYVGVFNGNVRTVESGELYRSGQLRGKHLAYVLESKRIRSVINLRGYSKTDTDLDRERNLSKAMGVKHVDISMSASRLPEPNELRKLINAFDVLPRPILVHCLGGSDRSGLASTLYMSIYKRMPLDQAQASQLTCRYGHISFGKAHAMDDFFSMYRQTAGNLSIREWILTRYPKIYLDSISRKSKRSAPIQPTDH